MKICFPRSGRFAAIFIAGLFICSLGSNSAVAARPLLPVTVTVQGNGEVNSSPDGIRCTTECTQTYKKSSLVGLKAKPAPDSRFVAWKGACTGAKPRCRVKINSSTNVIAVFEKISGTDSTGGSQNPAPASIVTLSANSFDFGNVDVGGVSNTSTVTLTNSGNAPLTITGITISEGFIKNDNCDNYLPAGTSCRVEMQFVPAVSGVTRGSLIVSGDANNAPFNVNLTGTSTDSSQSGSLPKIVDSNAPGVYFHHDFDNESLHTYTADDLRTTWNNASGSPQTNAVKIVPDPDPSGTHGNVMQVFYAGNKYLHGGDSGSRWQMDIGSHDEMYFAYDVYFEGDAEFVRGGKLPGLSSVGVYSSAGTASDGTDRWTGVLMWHEEGSILNYVYHANQPGKFGDNIDWDDGPNGQVNFQRGKWHRVEMHYKMNTPGILDGSLQAWLDGVKVLDTNKIMYRMPGGEDLKIGTLQFLTFYGGSDSSWAPSTDQHTYFDNFVVSTQPITH